MQAAGWKRIGMLVLLLAAALAAGCGGGGAGGGGGPRVVSFATAEQATVPATIEGRLERGTLRQQTGQPTEFTLREEASANLMRVVVPPEVTVPANITSAYAVTVTGTYNAAERRFTAAEVTTRVPTREQQ